MAMKRKNLPAVVPEVVPQVFEFEDYGQIRFVYKGEEIWFVATDVCRALDIKNPRDALTRLDDDEKGVALTDTLGGEQKINIVSEPGLYRLVFASRKKKAKEFQRKVYHEVLPSIRKYGYYVAPQKIEENLPELPAPNTVVKGFEEITTLMKKDGDEWYYDWIETVGRNGEKKHELGLKPFPRYFARIIF